MIRIDEQKRKQKLIECMDKNGGEDKSVELSKNIHYDAVTQNC